MSHQFLDIHDGLSIALDKIVALEALDEYSSVIHVLFGSEVRVFEKNVPLYVLKDIILSRNSAEQPVPSPNEQIMARSLEQLAKYQQSFAG